MTLVLDAPVLATARLTLSPVAPADVSDLFTIRGDAEAMRFWDWPGDATQDRCAATISRFLGDMARGEALYWTARCSEDGSFSGLFHLAGLGRDTPSIGFMVPRALWRQGIAGEACAPLIAQARARGHRALMARVHDGDRASIRLLGQFGFIENETRRAVEVRPGFETQCRFYALPLRRREQASAFAW